MKKFTYLIGFVSILFGLQGCTEAERNIDFLQSIPVPSNLSLQVQLSQDNTGTATLTPSGDSSSLFRIDFGDGSEAVEVSPGSSASHQYAEGSFTALLTAFNLNGDSAEVSQPVEVSFLPPQNLVITVTPVSGDNFSVNVSAEADFAVGFEVYFGDVNDEQPTPLMVGETITHTYPAVGVYELRVVALSGGAETTEGTVDVVIEDPITLPLDFESPTIDYVFIDFGGAFNTLIDNPDPTGVNTSSKVVEFFKEEGAEVFAGTVIELGEPIDFSELQSFSIDTWSPLAGSTVKLKIENGTDPNISAEIDAVTTTTNEWETLFFDFTDMDLTPEYSKVVVFFDFGNVGAGDTFYYDNIQLAQSEASLVGLPLDFEDPTVNYTIIGFEGAESTIEPNPDPSGINTSGNVVQSVKTVGAQFFAGTAIPLDIPIDFSTTESISIKTWSPKANIPVRLKLENAGGDFVELDVNTTTINQWEELVWDFTGMTNGIEFTQVVIFFEFVVDLPGDGSTYY
ncbi:MAG: hypothetical protein HKO54_08010, partial [Flavobacteriaceae bacterium]|nr:hypothetical protein [Flavobacteriaceae bacterium]